MSRPSLIALAILTAGCPGDPGSAHREVGSNTGAVSDAAGPDVGGDSTDTSPADLDSADLRDQRQREDLSENSPPVRPIERACPGEPIAAGAAWTGWGNLQFPRVLELETNEVSEPVFGQVWQEGVTDAPGAPEGWEVQLVIGPLGAHPEEQPSCFRALSAVYNVDDANNDEYWVRVRPDRAGLYGMFYRYRPPGGGWLYGDLDGSDDGVSRDQAAVVAVDDPAGPAGIRAITLNLRCRTDDWDARFDLVVEALVDADPHVIGFQEDCAIPGQRPQSLEILAQIAERLDRGFEAFHLVTHQATHPEGTFDEGLALLSSFPIDLHYHLDLPSGNFPRKALVADVRLGSGDLLRLVNTHFDYGAANASARSESAALIVAELEQGRPTILLGDLNTVPDSEAYNVLDAALIDAWLAANPGENGFTIPADAPSRRIDFVFASGLTIDSANLVGAEADGIHLSDHLGVAVGTTR